MGGEKWFKGYLASAVVLIGRVVPGLIETSESTSSNRPAQKSARKPCTAAAAAARMLARVSSEQTASCGREDPSEERGEAVVGGGGCGCRAAHTMPAVE